MKPTSFEKTFLKKKNVEIFLPVYFSAK